MCKFAFRFEFKLENMISYLQIDKLTKSFGDLVLFEDITFGVAQGQKIGLIAKNGTGKTTLLNIIGGKEDYDSGEVVFRKDLRVGYLEQSPSYPEELTVLQACFHSKNETVQLIAEYEEAMTKEEHSNLEDILTRMDSFKAWDYEQKAKQILGQLKIHNFNQKIGELSGGQLKRVALANVLITDPELIILDEPTNHLDITSKEILESALNQYTGTVFFVSHDRYFINQTATRILELTGETVVNYIGNYDYYLEKHDIMTQLYVKPQEISDIQAGKQDDAVNKLDWQAQKAEQARIRKIENSLKKIEDEIAALEEEISAIDEECAKPENAVNSAKLNELAARQQECRERLETCYETWEDLSMQLDGAKDS